jgi:hypothetical protein
MDAVTARQWFLRKHEDGTVFGPIGFEQLARWASSAQVAPRDSVSSDGESWMKAPMLAELGMDWIVEITSERLYGPTTLGSLREFLRLGEIDENSFVINACDGTRQQIRDIAPQLAGVTVFAQAERQGETTAEPLSTGMSVAVQERIAELERALRDERRALADLEERYRGLEAKHDALVNAAAVSRTS